LSYRRLDNKTHQATVGELKKNDRIPPN